MEYKNTYYDKNDKLFYYRKRTEYINIKKSFKNEADVKEFEKIIDEDKTLTNEKINDIYNLKFNKPACNNKSGCTNIFYDKNKNRWIYIYYIGETKRKKVFDIKDEAIRFNKLINNHKDELNDNLINELYLKI